MFCGIRNHLTCTLNSTTPSDLYSVGIVLSSNISILANSPGVPLAESEEEDMITKKQSGDYL